MFILADDYGLDGVGCYGSDAFKGKTPHIDALATSGIRFERVYSTPLCGPTRVQLLTGRYGFRTGALTNPTTKNASARNEFCLPRMLKEAGYATGMAGKWVHIRESPTLWGFDEFITDPEGDGWYWEKSYTKNGKEVRTETEIYYPDVTMEFAREFMRKNREHPFFFYFPTHLVHSPIVRTPDSKPGDDLYTANVAYLDKQVGQLVAELDELRLREKTLIIFAGDNGTSGHSSTIGGRRLSGQKGNMLEGGARVPFIASWKGITPTGKVLPDLINFADMLPTFAEAAGVRLPDGLKLDGRSFLAQLRGAKGNPREWAFVQLGEKWYVCDQQWKLSESRQLFDLSDAPFSEKLVSADNSTVEAIAARKRLQAALDELSPATGKTAVQPDPLLKAQKQRRKKTRE